PTWTPGMYMLLNARSKTAADLSGHDSKTVIGYQPHGAANQQWEFVPSRNGYTIRCLHAPGGHAIYMTVEGGAKENSVVVATERRTEWNVEQTGEGLRISWPNSNLVFHLEDTMHEPEIILKTWVPGELRQLWSFIRSPFGEPQSWPQPARIRTSETLEAQATPARTMQSPEVVVEHTRVMSDPATSETVTVSKSDEFVTITRTTTTTTTTTVTEVIRTSLPGWAVGPLSSVLNDNPKY
ncbi:hypothetical protein V8D89_000871, partial [Ganoderma adspersum]